MKLRDFLTLKSGSGILLSGNTYKPYINYTWVERPNGQVQNIGSSGQDLQLYSGNPLDFQATQGIQVNKSFTLSGNAISLFLGFDTDSIAITQTLAEFDNLKVSIVNATLKVTINAVEHNVATIALNTYYQTEIVINSNNLTVKLNVTQTYSASCTALNTTILKSLGANNGLASGRFDGQLDYFIVYNGLTTFSLSNQFFKDMSTDANTLFATDFRGNSSNIKDYKSGMTYPIINYSATQRTNFTQESKGLQDLTRLFDSNGFFLDNTDYLNCNGKGKATVIEPSRTSKVTIQTNPTILSGNILSGGVTLTTAGLTAGIDNDIVLDNQAISSNIDIGVGYKGKVTIYKEDLL